ncbi:hypothetical protein Tco_0834435 [Tanacetum coccineum]
MSVVWFSKLAVSDFQYPLCKFPYFCHILGVPPVASVDVKIESIISPMCDEAAQSSRHIFFICRITREVLCKISRWWDVSYWDLSSYEDWLEWILSLRLSVKHKQFFEGVCYAMWWHIWSFRNKCVFDSEFPSKAVIFEDVVVSWSFYWCRYRCKYSLSWIE